MILIYDTESDGLLDKATCLWMICVKEKGKPVEKYTLTPIEGSIGTIEQGLGRLSEAEVLVCHNQIQFDLPLLEMLYGWKPNEKTFICDTLVLSRLLDPDRVGGHSLGEWGKRLGRDKPAHEDWTKLSHDMLHRCSEDVEINTVLYERLWREYLQDSGWKEAFKLESEVARIIGEQERRGVKFDVDYANKLLLSLDDALATLDRNLLDTLPDRVKRKTPVTKPFKRDGSPTKQVMDWFEGGGLDVHSVVCGPFSRISFEPFNLNSHTQIKEYLLDSGWKPTQWNTDSDGNRTSPKLSEDSFGSIKGTFGEYYKERTKHTHRRNQISGWLERVRDDGRLSAGAITIGTNTCRLRHINVVNVPKASPEVFLGREMRSLFTSSPGRKLVGYDAAGLELRLLAHYMNDPEFTRALLEGDKSDGSDIHTLNQRRAGLPTRDNAKTFIYAFIYGAGDKKLGQIVQGNRNVGKQLREQFLESYPNLRELIEATKVEAKQGWIRGLDGRRIRMRRDKGSGEVLTHKALNTLIQSAGAIVMKRSMVELDDMMGDVFDWKVLDMHDEAQLDVLPNHVQLATEMASVCIPRAGKHYNLNIPLEADVKVGVNWAETH